MVPLFIGIALKSIALDGEIKVDDEKIIFLSNRFVSATKLHLCSHSVNIAICLVIISLIFDLPRLNPAIGIDI